MAHLLHHLISEAARRDPHAVALRCGPRSLSYGALAQAVLAAAHGFLGLGLVRGERVAILLDRRAEALLGILGAAAAGLVCVLIDPQRKAAQVAQALRESGAGLLLTTPARLGALKQPLAACPALRMVLKTGGPAALVPPAFGLPLHDWDACMHTKGGGAVPDQAAASETALLLYPACDSASGAVGALSHASLLDGAATLAARLGMSAQDRVLGVLPLSTDAGLHQVHAALASGAVLVLFNPLLMRDIPEMVMRERITGLAATPTMWRQLATLDWGQRPPLRYIDGAGGAIAHAELALLQRRLPALQLPPPAALELTPPVLQDQPGRLHLQGELAGLVAQAALASLADRSAQVCLAA